MKVSDLISNFFKCKGIDTVFGIIGSANSHLYDSFSRDFRIVNVHHEQTAVMSAGAYYRTCGKIAIALVTAGAGATNAVTGIVGAWADSIPVIILSGQESKKYVEEYSQRRMYGTQGLDIVHMVSKVTKYSSELSIPMLEYAYNQCLEGRPGPVLLDVPFDLQSMEYNEPLPDYIPFSRICPSINDINFVHSLLESCHRPVILAGHGIKLSGARNEFRKLVKIPILLSWSSIDLLSHDEDLYFGMPGIYGNRHSNHIIQQCDLLIVIGSRLALPQTGYRTENYAKNAKIVVVDIDKTENKSFVDKYIYSDCLEFIKNFDIPNTNRYDEWITECKMIRIKFPIIEQCHDDKGKLPNSYKIINKLSDLIEPDAIIVTDMGTALLSGHQAIKLGSGHTMFTSYGLGEMGFGLPAAIGASVANPNRQVICLNCDGSMMMNIQELQTIKQHNMNVKIIIFNNDGYLMIKHTQKMLFNGVYNSVNSDTGITLPDYIEIGNAFEYSTSRIHSWEDFDTTFLKDKTPSICEIMMEPEQDFLPKLKGVLVDGIIKAPDFNEMSPLLS